MKHFYLLISAFLLFCSCTPKIYYQVYDVETVGLQQKGDVLVYENEDCVISYSLWGNGGNLGFVFQNKLDQNLYLVMPQCFLIHNGWALDYYDDNSYSYSATNTSSAVVSAQASLYGLASHYDHWHPVSVSRGAAVASANSHSNTVTFKAPKIICIPAKSSKVIDGFKMSSTVHLECENKKHNFPSKSISYAHYDQTNTPLFINNVLVYSTDPNGNDGRKVENQFWVKSFTNYSQRAALDRYNEKDCATGAITKFVTFKMQQPFRFYNIYNSNTSRGSYVEQKGGKRSRNNEDDIYGK